MLLQITLLRSGVVDKPIILATREAEIRGQKVRSSLKNKLIVQPKKKNKSKTKPGMVAHTCKPSNSGGVGRSIVVPGQPLSEQQNGWAMAQVLESMLGSAQP